MTFIVVVQYVLNVMPYLILCYHYYLHIRVFIAYLLEDCWAILHCYLYNLRTPEHFLTPQHPYHIM
jgi:hypothetical protein